MDVDISLAALTLKEYTAAKVREPMLDVVFENEKQLLGNGNAQEKCKDLTFPFARSPPKHVSIKHSKILTESRNVLIQEKEIREITVDIKDFKEFDWQPGDTIAILSNNSSDSVVELLQLLQLESKADTVCSVIISKLCTKKNAEVPKYIPTRTTPREILRDCLNLKGVLKKTFLSSLAEYCSENKETQFLKYMSSKEGSSFYNDFVNKSQFNLTDILKLCKSCKPPFGLIIENMSRLLPRPYSIANSPLKTADEINFIFSTLDVNPGITTKMLKEKSSDINASLIIYIRESSIFRYTENNYHQNQILIGIGTGLAPFLGFLQHKEYIMNKEEGTPGKTFLFVGAPTQQSIIHRSDLLKWQAKNVLNNYVESLSRVPTARFQYVQDALEGNAKDLVYWLMKPETRLYLCADAGQISKSIENCLKNVVAKELAVSEAESTNLLKEFKIKKKYIEDIWL